MRARAASSSRTTGCAAAGSRDRRPCRGRVAVVLEVGAQLYEVARGTRLAREVGYHLSVCVELLAVNVVGIEVAVGRSPRLFGARAVDQHAAVLHVDRRALHAGERLAVGLRGRERPLGVGGHILEVGVLVGQGERRGVFYVVEPPFVERHRALGVETVAVLLLQAVSLVLFVTRGGLVLVAVDADRKGRVGVPAADAVGVAHGGIRAAVM